MELKRIGKTSATIVTLPNGTEILFSYSTPVGALTTEGKLLRAREKYSNTTSRHLNQWCKESGLTAETVKQSVISSLIVSMGEIL